MVVACSSATTCAAISCVNVLETCAHTAAAISSAVAPVPLLTAADPAIAAASVEAEKLASAETAAFNCAVAASVVTLNVEP